MLKLALPAPLPQGPGILGNRIFTLQAALGGQLPTDTSPSCPAPAPFVLRACPGAAPKRVCVPGSHPLTGLESGCCACRRVKATAPVRRVADGCIAHAALACGRRTPWLADCPRTRLSHGCLPRLDRPPCPQYVLVYPAVPMVNTYYETTPSCKVAARALLGGTIVHYTGALVRGNPWLGCRPEKYAKVVLEVSCPLQPSRLPGCAAHSVPAQLRLPT